MELATFTQLKADLNTLAENLEFLAIRKISNEVLLALFHL